MHILKKVFLATIITIVTMVAPSLKAEASSKIVLNETQRNFVNQFHEIAAELGYEYDIPWEAVMAQGIVESGAGTSYQARHKHNLFGLGAYDSQPYSSSQFETDEDCWRAYFEIISNKPRYVDSGALNHPADPYAYIQVIKDAGYATAENYVPVLNCYIKAVEAYSTELGWESSAQIISKREAEKANLEPEIAGQAIASLLDSQLYGHLGASLIIDY